MIVTIKCNQRCKFVLDSKVLCHNAWRLTFMCKYYSISNLPTSSGGSVDGGKWSTICTGLSPSTVSGIPGILTKMCYFHISLFWLHVCYTINLKPLKTDLDILSYLLLCTFLRQCSSSQQQPKLWLISRMLRCCHFLAKLQTSLVCTCGCFGGIVSRSRPTRLRWSPAGDPGGTSWLQGGGSGLGG